MLSMQPASSLERTEDGVKYKCTTDQELVDTTPRVVADTSQCLGWQHFAARNDVMAIILKVWCQIKNAAPAKFHPDPILKDVALCFSWKRSHQHKNYENKMSSNMRSVPDLKNEFLCNSDLRPMTVIKWNCSQPAGAGCSGTLLSESDITYDTWNWRCWHSFKFTISICTSEWLICFLTAHQQIKGHSVTQTFWAKITTRKYNKIDKKITGNKYAH